jgi:hypothetical protein
VSGVRVSCYLVITPTWGWYEKDRVQSAQVTAMRQNQPGPLRQESRAVKVTLVLPDGFFRPPVAEAEVILPSEPDEDWKVEIDPVALHQQDPESGVLHEEGEGEGDEDDDTGR